MDIKGKIIQLTELDSLAARLKSERRKIVTTNGCFDLLHYGHLHYLNAASELGDVFIVGINDDKCVLKLKGEGRPIITEELRAYQLAALGFVDYVVIFPEHTPLSFIKLARSDIHVKGADYRDKDIPEKKLMKDMGGRMVFQEFVEGFSTTKLLDKIRTACQP